MRTNEQSLDLARSWVENEYFDQSDRAGLAEILKSGNDDEIFELFYKDLSFGTAGLRSIVGFGPNRMNVYNVTKAAYSLGKASLNSGGTSVAISYDSRHTSEEYSKKSAEILAKLGLDVYIVPRPTPTPLLSFFIRELKCSCGIMMTASHNPPEYNGFKAYWSDGGQLIPPNDQAVMSIFKETSWSELDFESIRSGKIKTIDQSTYDKYFEVMYKQHLRADFIKANHEKLSIIYTPLHGVGGESAQRAFTELGFSKFSVLASQGEPNGDFPTTNYPNPEDPEALTLAVESMIKSHADLVIASDPDADRMGIAINDKEVYYPTGNEIVYFLLYYKLLTLKEFNQLPKNAFIIRTIVTSRLQDKIAKHFNVDVHETLTGFKWICAGIDERKDLEFIFGSEESFGSLSHNGLRDKDGISSATLFAEMMLFYKAKNMKLVDLKDELFKLFGYHEERLVSLNYEGSSGLGRIQSIMDGMRLDGVHEITDLKAISVRDYLGLYEYSFANSARRKLDFSHSSNVLSFYYEEGLTVHVRPSGTEPKIKFYLQYESPDYHKDSKMKAKIIMERVSEAIRGYCEQA